MQPLMRQLNLDHRRFLRLFSCVQNQLDLYRSGNWLLPDPEMILNVLDYMQAYPEFYHHPSEDILFAELLERDIPQSYTVESLLLEHQEMESLTRSIKTAFKEAIANDSLPSEHLIDETYDYLGRQVNHLSTEKNSIYPVVDIYLSEQVISNLNLNHKEIVDPLFGTDLQSKYDGLFEKIRETDLLMQRDGFSFI